MIGGAVFGPFPESGLSERGFTERGLPERGPIIGSFVLQHHTQFELDKLITI